MPAMVHDARVLREPGIARWIPLLLLIPVLACGPAPDGRSAPEGSDRSSEVASPGVAGETAVGDESGAADSARDGRERAYGIRLVTDRAVYAPGDTIHMHLEIFRRGGQALTLHFPSAQRHDFVLRGPASEATPGVAWRWSDGRFFAQASDTVTLGPGRTALTAEARHPAPGRPGRYRLEGRITASEWPISASVPITVAP